MDPTPPLPTPTLTGPTLTEALEAIDTLTRIAKRLPNGKRFPVAFTLNRLRALMDLP